MTGSKWQISDEHRGKMAPFIPEYKTGYRPGTYRKRIDIPKVTDALACVLRTARPWNARHETESGSAHRRFRKWCQAEVFAHIGLNGQMVSTQWEAVDRAGLTINDDMTTVTGKHLRNIRLVTETIDTFPADRSDRRLCLCSNKKNDAKWRVSKRQNRCGEPPAPPRKEKMNDQARRWIVERAYSGINRLHQLQIRREKTVENEEAMVHFSCGIIAWNKILL